MKRLYLILWWHMHQPLYKDPYTGYYELPWTFLHSIKDYYDMPAYLNDFEGLKANFNLTPVLIDQIQEYAEGIAKDRLLEALRKRHEELTDEQINFLKKLFYTFRTRPIYSEFGEWLNYRDLQVYHLLAWCGRSLEKESELVRRLKKKKKAFTEKEKDELINEVQGHIRKIIPIYKNLHAERRISLTTSPYYHPILPILLNPQCVYEATPNVELPSIEASFREDALQQVDRARERFFKIFGFHPPFFWPSEGGVSDEALKLLYERGVNLVATDEAVLKGSLPEGNIYKLYRYGELIYMLFRDRELSDMIGFSYMHWQAEDAVRDFMGRLRRIYEANEFSPIVSVIMDGENAWEFYPQNGREFLERLFAALKREEWVETITLEELHSLENIEIEEIERVRSGSWVNGSFLKWIGNPEKNRYWDMLSQAKRNSKNDYILVAEGSDWFWWQGENIKDPFLDTFDKLFKNFLRRSQE